MGLLAWLLWRADWGGIVARLSGTAPEVWLYSPLMTIALFLLRAWRWWSLAVVGNQGAMGLGRAWAIYATGFFLGAITPGRLGDMAKAVYGHREGGLPLARTVAGTLVDRLFDAGLLALMAGWALWHLGLGRGWYAQASSPWIYGLPLAALGGIGFLGWTPVRSAVARPFRKSRWGRFALGVGEEIQGLAGRRCLAASGLTLAAYAVYFSHTFLLSRSLGMALSYADMVAITVLIGLAAFLPISVAGLGTREGVLVVAMGALGVANSLEVALAYAALFFLACYVFPALLGLGCWWARPLSLADVRSQSNKVQFTDG